MSVTTRRGRIIAQGRAYVIPGDALDLDLKLPVGTLRMRVGVPATFRAAGRAEEQPDLELVSDGALLAYEVPAAPAGPESYWWERSAETKTAEVFLQIEGSCFDTDRGLHVRIDYVVSVQAIEEV